MRIPRANTVLASRDSLERDRQWPEFATHRADEVSCVSKLCIACWAVSSSVTWKDKNFPNISAPMISEKYSKEVKWMFRIPRRLSDFDKANAARSISEECRIITVAGTLEIAEAR